MKQVAIEQLTKFGVSLMVKRGVPEDDAKYISIKIVEAEAFQRGAHGINQFVVIDRALGKDIDPKAKPKIQRQSQASAVIDGDMCFGLLSMKLAKELAMERAEKLGTGFVQVRNTQWVASLGIHMLEIAENGYLGKMWVQAGLDQDCAPFGGIEPKLSTNPIALSFPTGNGPVVADFSTTTMSNGTSYDMIRKGQKSEVPRFLDNKGRPSCDPAVRNQGGTLMLGGGDVDGHKFYALSLFSEALTVMAGGNANDPKRKSNQSFSLLILNPEKFGGYEHFISEMKDSPTMSKLQDQEKTSTKSDYPAKRGLDSLNYCRKNGIPLENEKIEKLNEIAKNNQIEPLDLK